MTTALLLDLDDTLIDTRAGMLEAGRAAARVLWPGAGRVVHQAAGAHFHADPRGFFGQYVDGSLDFASMRASRVADLVETFSLARVADAQASFERVYEPAFRANVRCFDDVAPLLAWATSAGVPVGLLTNSGDHYTEVKLELSGLSDAFAVVVTRDTLGFGKPDPRAFHHACQRLRPCGSLPGETMYVGDHLSVDAVGATEAGLYGVWLQRDPCDTEGAARARELGIPVVTSLSQVPALLADH
jgi:putative hydrolase of the HAD superfamily